MRKSLYILSKRFLILDTKSEKNIDLIIFIENFFSIFNIRFYKSKTIISKPEIDKLIYCVMILKFNFHIKSKNINLIKNSIYFQIKY